MIQQTRKRVKKLALPKFSFAAQEISVAQNLEGLQPTSPPDPYAYGQIDQWW